ncbi:MAG: AI-2E family transporter [Akkermansia sp.]|nr:AI-2E family transporter [Akkermansia sp.]MBR3944541.1 AI-2E family transporter [Akkermansia sp.]
MSTEEKPYPTPLQQRVMWSALTLLSLAFIVVLACASAYGLVQLFVALEAVLLPVLVAGILAYLLNPVVKWLQRYVVRRIWAVLVVMLAAFGLMTSLFLCIVPPLVKQSNELYDNKEYIASNIITSTKKLLQEDRYVQHVVDMLYQKAVKEDAENNPVAELPRTDSVTVTAEQTVTASATAPDYETKLQVIFTHHSGYLVQKGVEWLTAGGRFLFGLTYVFIGIIVIPVFLFYFLLETEPIAKNWDKILPLRNSYLKDEIVATLSEINQNVVAFVRGQMLVSLIDAFILGIALSCLGLPYALTIAAAVAILGIIPYIGMISTGVPAMLVAWFTWHDFGMVVAVAAIFLSVSQLDGWLLQPKIVGKNMKMHDMTVMFSVLFWSLVFGGVFGALIAVPLTAAIKVIFKRYVWAPLSKDASAEISSN